MNQTRTRLICLVLLLASLVLGTATAAHAAQYTYYSLRTSGEDCWATGRLGSESTGCDMVGPGFFEKGISRPPKGWNCQ